MAETIKRITLALSKLDLEYLSALQECLGENANSIMKRALESYYNNKIDVNKTIDKE